MDKATNNICFHEVRVNSCSQFRLELIACSDIVTPAEQGLNCKILKNISGGRSGQQQLVMFTERSQSEKHLHFIILLKLSLHKNNRF